MTSRRYLMLRSAACPEEPPQAASKGARLEGRTAAMQPIPSHAASRE
jgi:hypothetical protein